jgi:hypothetical protein
MTIIHDDAMKYMPSQTDPENAISSQTFERDGRYQLGKGKKRQLQEKTTTKTMPIALTMSVTITMTETTTMTMTATITHEQ